MGDARQEQFRQSHMDRALSLARRGAGRTAPNPMVGCVIVSPEGEIIGEGWHQKAGGDHAEIAALKAAGPRAKGASVFVTLEPCNHQGRTGPCAKALIDAGVKEVFYAMDDPNALAAGGGEALRAAGVNVMSGLRQAQARELNRAWLFSFRERRPYIIGKSAMSLDGRIATQQGESQWITSDESRREAHLLRASADAILVGAQTVIDDDPALSARLEHETRYPLRIVLDSTARTAPGAKIYERNGPRTPSAILATTKRATPAKLAAFAEMGVETLELPADAQGRPDLSAVLTALYERQIVTLLIEGGGDIMGAFFDADLLDEIEIFVAPKLIGGGKPAFAGGGIERLSETERFEITSRPQAGPDLRFHCRRRRESA